MATSVTAALAEKARMLLSCREERESRDTRATHQTRDTHAAPVATHRCATKRHARRRAGIPHAPPRAHPMPPSQGTLPWTDEPPRTRADCIGRERPCPWVRCRHHLLLTVSDTGTLTTMRRLSTGSARHPLHNRHEPGCIEAAWLEDAADLLMDMPYTCALDVAELGGTSLEELGDIFQLTRERMRQIEMQARESMAEELAIDDEP